MKLTLLNGMLPSLSADPKPGDRVAVEYDKDEWYIGTFVKALTRKNRVLFDAETEPMDVDKDQRIVVCPPGMKKSKKALTRATMMEAKKAAAAVKVPTAATPGATRIAVQADGKYRLATIEKTLVRSLRVRFDGETTAVSIPITTTVVKCPATIGQAARPITFARLSAMIVKAGGKVPKEPAAPAVKPPKTPTVKPEPVKPPKTPTIKPPKTPPTATTPPKPDEDPIKLPGTGTRDVLDKITAEEKILVKKYGNAALYARAAQLAADSSGRSLSNAARDAMEKYIKYVGADLRKASEFGAATPKLPSNWYLMKNVTGTRARGRGICKFQVDRSTGKASGITIGISPRLFNTGYEHTVITTIIHELCHQAAVEHFGISKVNGGHDSTWSRMMMAFGLEPARYSKYDREDLMTDSER